jgi:hypothetical protein
MLEGQSDFIRDERSGDTELVDLQHLYDNHDMNIVSHGGPVISSAACKQ